MTNENGRRVEGPFRQESRALEIRPWLFPATYVVHLAEETWAAGGFHRWIAAVGGAPATTTQFLTWHLAGLTLTIVATWWPRRSVREWLVAILAATFAVNGVAHGVVSAATDAYVPGTVSGLLVWVPLGVVALRRTKRHNARIFWTGLAIGTAVNGIVAVLAFTIGRIG